MNSEEFRKAGYEILEFAANYIDTLQERNPLPRVEPGYLVPIIPKTAPQKPEPWANIMKDLEHCVVDGLTHWGHRQFHAYFPSSNSFPSILGDLLSNCLGINGATWDSCPVATELEHIVVDWVCKYLALPDFFLNQCSNPESEGGGCIQGSASESILCAMVSAREDCVKALRRKYPDTPRAVLLNRMVAYRSSQCHSSVEKNGRIGTMRVRSLPADDKGNVRAKTLRAAIRKDISTGLIPYLYVAILGSTGVCAFDDLTEIGPVCQRYSMWLHVDAAYAGSSFICPEMRYLSKGMEYAWSFNINCNKWMLVCFDCSILWMRYRRKLIGPNTGYVQDHWTALEYPIVSLRNWSISSTRRFRALKLWFTIRTYGIEGIRNYHRNHIRLAKLLERYIDQDERFDIIGVVRVGLVCFRIRGTNEMNSEFLDNINSSRRLHMVPSIFQDQYLIRFSANNEHLADEDIDIAWKIIDEFATAVIRKYITQQKDADLLEGLFQIQEEMDTDRKNCPESEKEYELEQKNAEEISRNRSSRPTEFLIVMTEFTAVDGSYGGPWKDKGYKDYDDYLKSHPEELQTKKVMGEPLFVNKAPGMLRTEIVDIAQKQYKKWKKSNVPKILDKSMSRSTFSEK